MEVFRMNPNNQEKCFFQIDILGLIISEALGMDGQA